MESRKSEGVNKELEVREINLSGQELYTKLKILTRGMGVENSLNTQAIHGAVIQ